MAPNLLHDQEKYSSYVLEVLAVILVVKKFRVYLLGTKFRIITDCAAFQRTMNKKDLPTRVTRWALLLRRKELRNSSSKRCFYMPHVDALSRHPIMMTMIEEEN